MEALGVDHLALSDESRRELDRFNAVYDRYALPVGAEIEGPAMVEERESTCVIGPEDRAVVDRHLNLVTELGE